MEILSVILQLVVVFVGWFIITYVKKLPEQVHAKNLKSFEHDLNTQLENFRNKLTTDLERARICQCWHWFSVGVLQLYRVERI
ncbi:hypothetical protein BLX91_05220 [Bacillus subtilis]|uniref:hypothetical protein n=1 Tax=Bacillus TaxID=1386 RepID=UPI000CB60E26|nr:hypothetical protein BLX91_05220 [Bacillus subtilis]